MSGPTLAPILKHDSPLCEALLVVANNRDALGDDWLTLATDILKASGRDTHPSRITACMTRAAAAYSGYHTAQQLGHITGLGASFAASEHLSEARMWVEALVREPS